MTADLSRRTFISLAAAGSAATLPAVALVEAGQSSASPRPPEELPLDEEISMVAKYLDSLLRLKHPGAEVHSWQMCPVDPCESVIEELRFIVAKSVRRGEGASNG